MKDSAALILLSSVVGTLAAPTEKQKLPERLWSGDPVPKHLLKEFAPQIVQNPWGGSVQGGYGWKYVSEETIVSRNITGGSRAGAATWVGIDVKSA